MGATLVSIRLTLLLQAVEELLVSESIYFEGCVEHDAQSKDRDAWISRAVAVRTIQEDALKLFRCSVLINPGAG